MTNTRLRWSDFCHGPEHWLRSSISGTHHDQSLRAMGDHLLYCNPRVCGLGDHVLSEPKKAQVKELPEPTQHELGVKASQEVRFSKTVNVGQFFSTRPECDAHGRSTAPYCKELTTPRSIEGSMTIRNIPGRTPNLSRATHFRLRGSRVSLKCRHHCMVLHGDE